MDLLGQLLANVDLERTIAVFFLVLARFAPLVFLAPFFAAQSLPPSARMGLTAALSFLVFPAALEAAGPLPGSGAGLALLLGREALVGALLGFLVAIPFRALEAGGRLIDSARGANMAEVLAAPTEVRSSPLGAFLLLLGVVLFLAVDGHLLVIQAVGGSYRTLPLGAPIGADAPRELTALAIHLGSRFFLVAAGLAAPVLAAVVLVDLSLGLAGRLSPQLPLYFLGLPAKALGGVALLLLALPLVVVAIGGLFRLALRAVDAALRALGA
ncbi:MAG: flagellar biosynthetic protein FliR [Polyangia bacterium]|jgi:flagellar biosynthetic protein FliR|nr:flagellar biosynthetic protein FliR [Polyangia bacterium]